MLWSRLEQLVRERDFYTAHLSEHRRLFAFTNCSLGTAEEVREEVSTHAPWRLLQTAWRAWSKRLVQTQAEIHSEKTNSTRQRGVTHLSSETKKIRTCNWKVTQRVTLFCGKFSNTLLIIRLPLTLASTQPAASFNCCPIVSDKEAAVLLPPLSYITFLFVFQGSLPFHLAVCHLFCPLASPLPLNQILLLSLHTDCSTMATGVTCY